LNRWIILLWLTASGFAYSQEADLALCSEQDVIDRDVALPDAIPFEPGHSALVLSEALGCNLISDDGTRSTAESGSGGPTPVVSIDAASLALLEILGPSPELDAFARDLDAAVFTRVAALSDRRAVIFVSKPAGAEIVIGSTSYGATTRMMGVRSWVLEQARLVMPGHADCAYADAVVSTEPDGTEVVSCELVPLN
jgi:hypothetical protein